MGSKYMILGKNYDDKVYRSKQSKYFICGLFWLIVYIIKYECVDFNKRS